MDCDVGVLIFEVPKAGELDISSSLPRHARKQRDTTMDLKCHKNLDDLLTYIRSGSAKTSWIWRAPSESGLPEPVSQRES